MAKINKPMLASAAEDIDLPLLRYPVWCTPKIDGIRTLMVDGKAVARSFKPVPNRYVRETMERELPSGLDGEYSQDGVPFTEISGSWRRFDGMPEFVYLIFDYVDPDRGEIRTYRERLEELKQLELPAWCRILEPVVINNLTELLAYEEKCLIEGHEGIMIRDPNGPYKAGRSTLKEGYLLKLKRFVDAEAEVVGYQELFHNANEATTNVFGRTERSGHRENMIPMGMLGALTVRGINGTYKDRVFNVGTGYDEATRIQLWKERGTLAGRIITYRFQEIGSKDKPRVPTWQGFRDPADQ